MEFDLLARLARAEAALPQLLLVEAAWQTLFVDYEQPFVERLWRPWEDGRLYVHRIHPCSEAEAFWHRHAWASAMRVKEGWYGMKLGHGPGNTPPVLSERFLLSAGSAYAMIHPDSWHAVYPIETPTLSIMVTSAPWGGLVPKSPRPLYPLTTAKAHALFADARRHYPIR